MLPIWVPHLEKVGEKVEVKETVEDCRATTCHPGVKGPALIWSGRAGLDPGHLKWSGPIHWVSMKILPAEEGWGCPPGASAASTGCSARWAEG